MPDNRFESTGGTRNRGTGGSHTGLVEQPDPHPTEHRLLQSAAIRPSEVLLSKPEAPQEEI